MQTTGITDKDEFYDRLRFPHGFHKRREMQTPCAVWPGLGFNNLNDKNIFNFK